MGAQAINSTQHLKTEKDFYLKSLRQIATTLLPQIDDISSLVEKNNHLLLRYPRLALEQDLELLPGIFPRPEIIGAERDGAMTRYHLIEGDADVLFHPNELQYKPWFLNWLHNYSKLLFFQRRFGG